MWPQDMMGPMPGPGKGGLGFPPSFGGMPPPGPPPMWGSPAFGFPQWGGGKGKVAPDEWPSQDTYLQPRLRQIDYSSYKSAGLLCYRKGEAGLELLLSLEKPWNVIRDDYDPISWNLLGGKRAGAKAGKEWQPQATVARCWLDIMGPVEGMLSDKTLRKMSRGPVLWYPKGKYVLFFHEIDGDEEKEALNDVATRYAAAKEQGAVPVRPPGDDSSPALNALGQPTQKWIKQVEALEWISAADLLEATPRQPLADLLKNVCEVEGFRKWLSGEGKLPNTPPAPAAAADGEEKGGSKGKGNKGKGGGWKGGKGGGFGGGFGGGGFGGGGYVDFGAPPGGGKKGGRKGCSGGKGGKGGYCKGMPHMQMPPMPHMQMQPMMPTMVPMPQDNPEVAKQFLGERVYVLVHGLLKNEFISQKVTGMLLELPEAELGPLLEPSADGQAALKQRVDEAIDVLKADNFID